MTLSVLHISTADNLGGSARSAYKIHTGLRQRGVRSRMLVGTRSTDDPDVDVIAKGLVRYGDKAFRKLEDRLSWQYLFFPSSFTLLAHPWFREADIVQIYNTHGGYFSHTSLPALSGRKRVAWRLSDAWPATGHCAYPAECEGWRTGCHGCPDLQGYPSLRRDTASTLWNLKRRLYDRSDIHVVAPSSWTYALAAESPLLSRFPRSLIPNGVDTTVFRPLDRNACRAELGLPRDKTLLFFAANVLSSNPRKGSEYFVATANRLFEQGRRDLMVMAVGEGYEGWGMDLKCPVWKRGLVSDDAAMARLYASADVFVHPAVLENMPNAIVEATACGIPSAAFDTGGVKDALLHRETGWLARMRDAEDLAAGVAWILERGADSFRTRCRGFAESKFSLDTQTEGFLSLYQGLMARRAA